MVTQKCAIRKLTNITNETREINFNLWLSWNKNFITRILPKKKPSIKIKWNRKALRFRYFFLREKIAKTYLHSLYFVVGYTLHVITFLILSFFFHTLTFMSHCVHRSICYSESLSSFLFINVGIGCLFHIASPKCVIITVRWPN